MNQPSMIPVYWPNTDKDPEFPYRKAIIRPADRDFFKELGAMDTEAQATDATITAKTVKKEPAKTPEKKAQK